MPVMQRLRSYIHILINIFNINKSFIYRSYCTTYKCIVWRQKPNSFFIRYGTCRKNKRLRSHNNEPSRYLRTNFRVLRQSQPYQQVLPAGTAARTRSRSLHSVDGNDLPPSSRSFTMEINRLRPNHHHPDDHHHWSQRWPTTNVVYRLLYQYNLL